MDIFDIIGPVMIGPSSSHTAGAARIALAARQIAGDRIKSARILMHGSFADTYKGHGTDKAVVGGLLGFKPDDPRLRDSMELAKAEGLDFSIVTADLGDVHPNTVRIETETAAGRRNSITGSSIGGGRIRIIRLNGMDVDFTGQYNTLVISHCDRPGAVAAVTGILNRMDMNIAGMKVYRAAKGGDAAMIIETDQKPDRETLDEIRSLPEITGVDYVFI